jgi:hypothetical protein
MRIIIEVDDQEAGGGAPQAASEMVGTAPGAPVTVGSAANAGAAAPPPGAETIIDGVIVMNAGPAPDDLAGPATGAADDGATAGSGAGADGSLSAGAAPDSP